jgi:prolyl-tRNA editing enzyme YbaK/EbsC (Cys-tRNA(Pro) deacylase)
MLICYENPSTARRATEVLSGESMSGNDLHPQIQKIAAALAEHGAHGSVRVLADSVRTAAQAAAALDCEVGAIANSLIFDADGAPLLILTSGAHRVDTDYICRTRGIAQLRRADPTFVRRHTGQAIGGVAPIGHPSPVRTLVDRWLDNHTTVWASAGHPQAVFSTTYTQLLELTRGTPTEVEETPRLDD